MCVVGCLPPTHTHTHNRLMARLVKIDTGVNVSPLNNTNKEAAATIW